MIKYLFKTSYISNFKQLLQQVANEIENNKEKQIMMTIEKALIAEGMEQGMEQGREIGYKNGIDAQKEQVAVSMLKDKQPLEFVVKYSGLASGVITQIKNKLFNRT